MIEDIQQIGRTEEISSQKMREFDDRVGVELSNQFHRILSLTGKVNILASCLDLTSNALGGIVNSLRVTDDKTIVCNAYTEPLFPAACDTGEYAERVPTFGSIIGRRVATKLLFTDSAGDVRSGIDVLRTSDNAFYLEKPDTIVENSRFHALTDGVPYLAKFMRDNMSTSNITLQILSQTDPFQINAIRVIAMPVLGGVVFESARFFDGTSLIQSGGNAFPDATTASMTRTYPAYLHFNTKITSSIVLSFLSELYNPIEKAVTVGISKIVGEYNIYAVTSHIGYTITLPEDATTITELNAEPDLFSTGPANIRLRLYDSLEHFNAMDDHYVVTCAKNIVTSINRGTGVFYLLVTITCIDNTSPSIGNITVRYQ